MAAGNVRFALGGDNKACSAATVVINGASSGTYPNRPTLSEDAQFPAANVLVNDRAAVYRTANALAGPYNFDLDLGADVPVLLVALHGIRFAPGQVTPNLVTIGYRTSTQGYDGNGAFTTLKANLPVVGRDVGAELNAPVRLRFLRFAFNVVAGGFQFSQIYAGLIRYDLGELYSVVYSPGARYVDTERAARTETMSGLEFVRVLGDEGMLLSLPYASIESDLAAVIRSLARETLPITHLSVFDDVMQVRRNGPDFARDHVWRNDVGDDQLDMTLELRKLA